MTTHAYILHTNNSTVIVGAGKERRTLVGPWGCKGSTRYWNYVEDYWLCAGGLSAVNAIGTQLRDPINSGLTRWLMMVFVVVVVSHIQRIGCQSEKLLYTVANPSRGLLNRGKKERKKKRYRWTPPRKSGGIP